MPPGESASDVTIVATRSRSLYLGGDARTILAGLYPAPGPRALPPARPLDVSVGPRARVRVFVHAGRPRKGVVVLVPGFTGHARSRAVMRAAVQACARGYTVVRVNLRNGGDTHALCDGLFHLQHWTDLGGIVQELVRRLRPHAVFALGFSLGGALLLNLVGRRPETAELVRGVAAISPPVDVPRTVACVDLPRNRLYTWLFLRSLVRDVDLKRELGHAYPDPRRPRPRTVPEYDRRFVLPETGFASLEEYYAQASALPWLHAIRCRTAILSSRDDPLIPFETIESARREAPRLRVLLSNRGGHCAYPARHGLALRSAAVESALDFFETSAPASGSA